MKMKKSKNFKKYLVVAVIIILLVVSVFVVINYLPEKGSFSVNTILLKLNIVFGGESMNKIKIKNNEDFEQTFNLDLNNLKSIASVSEDSFVLGPRKSKEISISFKDENNVVKIYTGRLTVQGASSEKNIPIILSVEDPNHVFAITQNKVPKYDSIYPGGKLGVEIKLFNLEDDFLHDINVKYSIESFDGETILSEMEDLVVKESLSLTKIIDIPESFSEGDYVFIVSVDYKETKTASSYLFSVSTEEGEELFSKDLRFFVIFVSAFLVGIIILFIYFIKTRDDLLIQLRRQQNTELRKNLSLVKYSKSRLRNLKGVQKKKKLGALKSFKKNLVAKIKKKHKAQKQEISKLKKKGKKGLINRKLNKWKKQGFSIMHAEKAIKKIAGRKIKHKVRELGKKGYSTEFLKK